MASLSSIMKKTFKVMAKIDPIGSKIREKTGALPGSPGSLQAAFTSDQPSDPYGKEQSKFDIFAGGTKLSESKSARNTGRAIGTVAALYFGAGAFGGGETAAGSTAAGGGAATTGGSSGVLGTGISGNTLATAGLTAASIVEQKKAAKAAEEASRQQEQFFNESMDRMRTDNPQTPTIDEARRRSERADAQRRKRGRRASILTGDTGVGATPISQRTLIGS